MGPCDGTRTCSRGQVALQDSILHKESGGREGSRVLGHSAQSAGLLWSQPTQDRFSQKWMEPISSGLLLPSACLSPSTWQNTLRSLGRPGTLGSPQTCCLLGVLATWVTLRSLVTPLPLVAAGP